MANKAMEVLKIIHRKPRVTPALIHSCLKGATNYPQVEQILRTLRETGQVKTISRGIYVITDKGVETLRTSEKKEVQS